MPNYRSKPSQALDTPMLKHRTVATGRAPSGIAGAAPAEIDSAYGFAPTLERLSRAISDAGLTIFLRIDHQAAAAHAGLAMPPTTVIIYGNPKSGTALMLSAPAIALDLPLRVLVREDKAGHTVVSFHRAAELTRAAGLPAERAAALAGAEALIAAAVAP
jgi:uncharacterized protein (DUF302 family)